MKLLGLLAALSLAAGANAQIVFSYALESDQNVIPILPGGTIRFPDSPVGVEVGAAFQITNRSGAQASVSGVGITGSAFRLTGIPLFPTTLTPGQTLSIRLLYRATSVSVPDAGQLTVTVAGEANFTINLEGIGRRAVVSVAYALAADQNVIAVAPGATIDLGDAGGNAPVEATLSIHNTGGAGAIVNEISVTGGAFRVSGVPLLPALIAPGQSLRVTLTYRPSGAAADTGRVQITFAGEFPLVFPLLGRDSGAALSLTYRTPGGSAIPITAGGTIELPPAAPGSPTTATLQVRNAGAQNAIFTAISAAGPAFFVANAPPLPYALPPGQSFEITLTYSPSDSVQDAGVLTLALASRNVTLNLAGRRLTSPISFVAATDPPVTVTAGGTLSLPDTNLGVTGAVAIQVVNNSPAPFRITQIGATGDGFSLAGLPALPQTVPAGGSVTFRVLFQPLRPGNSSGSLSVNEDRIFLRALGVGPQFSFRYESAGVTTEINESNPAVVFPSVAVTASAAVNLVIRNSGTGSGTISGIGISSGTGVFSLEASPALPASLAVGEELRIPVRFTPINLGPASGTLQVNASAVALTGIGTDPPFVPRFTITGPSGTVAPATQSRIELTLDQPYPAAIAGTLTLEAGGTLPADPAVQFASGGRTVAFEIPANTTRAIFPGRVPNVGVQTGTVASTMRVTPAFRTQAGGVELKVTTPASLEFSVPAAAPTIQLMQASNVGASRFDLIVTGFTTTRELTGLSLRFAAAPGASIANAEVRVDLRSVSSLWFQRQASQAFGGQFTLTLPLSLAGTNLGNQDAVSRLASVTAVVENSVGPSGAFELRLR